MHIYPRQSHYITKTAGDMISATMELKIFYSQDGDDEDGFPN